MGLRIRDIRERVHRVHQERLLQHQRRPDIARVVVVRPHDAELIEPREQRHAVRDHLPLRHLPALLGRVDRDQLKHEVRRTRQRARPRSNVLAS